MKIVLSIAGSDPLSGAGIQADLKTIHACGGYALTVITAITAQNSLGVYKVYPVSSEQIKQQLSVLLKDIKPAVIKLGILANLDIASSVIDVLKLIPEIPVVCDTVFYSSNGVRLLEEKSIDKVKAELFPLCDWITPNLPEARSLINKKNATEQEVITNLQDWSKKIKTNFILKGGHGNNKHTCVDTLITPKIIFPLKSEKIQTKNLHGTGCTFSSAFATYLAQGNEPLKAFSLAKDYIYQAILLGRQLNIGQHNGPLQHFFK